ncbi:MAG: hypothetical protein ACR2OZ_20295 [Verrucomicrobiales bacterium]
MSVAPPPSKSRQSEKALAWQRGAIWLGLGLTAGGAAGFFAGRQSTTASHKGSESSAAATRSPNLDARAPLKSHAAAGSAADLEQGGSFIVDDPARAFRDLLSISDVTVRNSALLEMLKSVPPERLPEILERFGEFIDKQEFEDEIGGLITAMSTFEVLASHVAANAPEQTLTLLVTSKKEKLGELCPLLLRQWAAHDFTAALSFFEKTVSSQNDDSLKQNCAEALAREYMKIHPEQALSWSARLPEEQREHAVRAAFQTLSHRDSELALRLVVERTDLPGRAEIAAGLAKGWAKTKPEEAFRWAASLPPELSKRAIAGAIEHWCDQDFQSAAAGLGALAVDVQTDALHELAGRAKAENAAAMVALLDKQPEGEARANATRTFVGKWAEQAPEEASQWLAAQLPGISRDHAAASFAVAVRDKDPEAAVEWMASITDPQLREKNLDPNFSQWLKNEPTAAQAWLERSATLTDRDRERLRRSPLR